MAVSFPINLYLLAACGGAVASAMALPLWRHVARRAGWVDDPGHRKIHEQSIPLAGGLAILTGLLVPLLLLAGAVGLGWLGSDTTEKLLYGLGRRGTPLSAILGGAIGMTLLGWLDDRHELRAAQKFAGQLLLALLVAAAGVRVTLFVPSVAFNYAVTVLWILTVTNAFNFMDNMNGLCGGLGAIAALALGSVAAWHAQYLVAGISFLVFGALLGFLPYNFPRATAFLGDAGSHLVGFLISVLAILPHYYSAKHPQVLAVFSPLLILAVPLGDLVWVVLWRWRRGRPFYIGDTNHLSHRLVRRGLSRTVAVLLIWMLAAMLGGLVFLL